jgi:hypothetical protein
MSARDDYPYRTSPAVLAEIDRLRAEVERLHPLAATRGAELIAAERRRQIEQEGWTPEHDAEHDGWDLTKAAITYAKEAMGGKYSYGGYPLDGWPWDEAYWKPSDDPIRNLVKAGALIAAEIDRLAAGAVSEDQP